VRGGGRGCAGRFRGRPAAGRPGARHAARERMCSPAYTQPQRITPRPRQASAMEKFNELEDEIAAMKQQLQARGGGGGCRGTRGVGGPCSRPAVAPPGPATSIFAPSRARLSPTQKPPPPPPPTPQPPPQADKEELAAWERASAAARSKGLFFKSLYTPEADESAAADGQVKQQQGGGGGESGGGSRFRGQLRGSLDPEAAAAARRAAAKVEAPAHEEVGSPLRLWLFAYMAGVLALVVVQGGWRRAPARRARGRAGGREGGGRGAGRRARAPMCAPRTAWRTARPHQPRAPPRPPPTNHCHRPDHGGALAGAGHAVRRAGPGAGHKRMERAPGAGQPAAGRRATARAGWRGRGAARARVLTRARTQREGRRRGGPGLFFALSAAVICDVTAPRAPLGALWAPAAARRWGHGAWAGHRGPQGAGRFEQRRRGLESPPRPPAAAAPGAPPTTRIALL
jgi:hypothetical protein